ncbi:MAG: N-acetylmuramoyl-L-alanine amidase [Rhodobacteraceae bacterium]|nr:N-acetylmuramoyl-L-alanine amidase [Paracoccaceae bacterium]
MKRLVAFLITGILTILPAAGFSQQLQALARLDATRSQISDRRSGDLDISLKLTQAVPYRVFTLNHPVRLVLDFREVNFSGIDAKTLIHTDMVKRMRTGLFRPGWSRMVLELAAPMQVQSVVMHTSAANGDAMLAIRLSPADAADFASATGAPKSDFWAMPKPAEAPLAKTRPAGDRKIVVVLDPGHGGIDPGARYQGYEEAALMLSLARELKEKLILSGRYEVHLTRDEDVFLSLQGRVSAARAAAADIFISLHADALAVGNASGATVYTLSEHASDLAAAALAEGHDRADLLAGVDLGEQDDLVATVLMDMARIETMPRSEKLADAIVQGIAESVGKIRSRPRLSAGFSVLKAPDIPSVLIEFGFMSNAVDLANLKTAKWRAQVIDGLLQAIDTWARNDAAEARLLRQ